MVKVCNSFFKREIKDTKLENLRRKKIVRWTKVNE